MSLTLLYVLGIIFLQLGCLVQTQYRGFCLVLLYLVVLFGCLFEAFSFLKGKKEKREDLGKMEVGGQELVEVKEE